MNLTNRIARKIMRTRFRHGLAAAALAIVCTLAGAFTAFASDSVGTVDPISGSTVSGWAVDAENPDQSAFVVLYVYTDGTTEAKELARVTADQYRNDLNDSAGNGRHGFSLNVDWDSMEGSSFIVEGYVETASGQRRLYGSPQYSKKDIPAAGKKASGPAGSGDDASLDVTKGAYLGEFETTAYCGCRQCCPGGHALTYSGTVPKAGHTISADISVFPIGTRLLIDGTVYTVEDVGSGVSGRRLDIYFDTHQQALDYGMNVVDVYTAE